MIDVQELLKDEMLEGIPIIYVLRIIAAIENQSETQREVLTNGKIEMEITHHV